MKKLSCLLSGLLLIVLITGCTSVKRYKSATYKSRDHTLVDMELFSAKLDPGSSEIAGKYLWNLSPSAQSQLVQILNERYPETGQFIRSLSNNYVDGIQPASTSLITRDLTMVFTISKKRDFTALNDPSGRFSPADRIEYLKFSLEIPESYNLRFRSWNRYITEYGEIGIADVSFSTSMDLSGDVQPVVKGDGGVKATVGRGEDQEVRSRFLKLNGSISDRKIEIEEEGNREIDLTGNVIADVKLEFEGYPERISIPLFAGEGTESAGMPELVSLKHINVVVPKMQEVYDTIRGTLVINYIYRHVQAGWKTYPEWDDRVEYYSGTVEKEVPLLTAHDYRPLFYCIGTNLPGEQALKLRTAENREYLLQFMNYEDASRFYRWLMGLHGTDSIEIGNESLWFKGSPVNAEKLKEEENLRIMDVSDLYRD